VKINQYCSVCKKHLDMEVIPTDDGGDDGVIWLRCPDCQGFLPKFTGEGMTKDPGRATADSGSDPDSGTDPGSGSATETASEATKPAPAPPGPPSRESGEAGPRSAAPPFAPTSPTSTSDTSDTDDLDAAEAGDEDNDEAPAAPDAPAAEPLAEYAARLAEADTTTARPYRPSSTYEEGEVIHHLAYDDVGIVVAKEQLPGGRKAVKVFFDQAGVMHLIEQAADGR
jgi:hypothetical protein